MREVSEHAEFGTIVSEWGKEFDVETVFKDEATAVIAGLPSIADASHVQMSSGAPLTMDVDDSLVQSSNLMNLRDEHLVLCTSYSSDTSF